MTRTRKALLAPPQRQFDAELARQAAAQGVPITGHLTALPRPPHPMRGKSLKQKEQVGTSVQLRSALDRERKA